MPYFHTRFITALNLARKFRGVILTFAVCINLGLLIADTLAPAVQFNFDHKSIRPEEGHAFIAPILSRYATIFQFRGDSSSAPRASVLQLFEDGQRLGPPHTLHSTIRAEGKGAYSHWGSQVYFSTSDNSDPRTNGRVYVAQGKAEISGVLQSMGLFLFACIVLLFYREQLRRWMIERKALGRWVAAANTPVSPSNPSAVAWLGVASVAIAIALLIFGWQSGASITFTVANYFPVSDARGYHNCATVLAATGTFDDVPWCSRRVLYPSMVATLLAASGWYGQIALLLQAILIGLAIMTVSLETARLLGCIAGLLVLIALFAFAQQFALSAFVTEAAGLSLGLVGVALLLRYVAHPAGPLLLLGVASVSIALTARAGSMLLLPALVLWGWLVLRNSPAGSRVLRVIPVLLAALAGPLLQMTLLLAFNIDPRNTGGNFSTVLYGLAIGSRDWSQAYRDFEPMFVLGESEAFRHVYKEAFSRISEDPGVFLNSLRQAGTYFLTTLFQFVPIAETYVVLSLLLVVGLIVCGFRWRTPLGSLLLAMAAGEAASAPLIIDSGGHRIFAASIVVRLLIMALGLHTILATVTPNIFRSVQRNGSSPRSRRSHFRVAILLSGIIVLTMSVPATPVGQLFRLGRLPELGCPAGLTEVVTRLHRESQTIRIIRHAKDSRLIPYAVAKERLVSDAGLAHSWYGPDFLELPAETLLIKALQRGQDGFGTIKYLVWFGPLPQHHQDTVSLCVDQKRVISLEQSHVSYQYVVSVRPLPNEREQ